MVKSWVKDHVIGLLGLVLAICTLCQAVEQFQWQNYSSLNQRYSEVLGGIPESIALKKHVKFDTLSPTDKAWVRSYFNLTSEEYYLYRKNLIPSEMWKKRILNGLNVNLKEYPILIAGFN